MLEASFVKREIAKTKKKTTTIKSFIFLLLNVMFKVEKNVDQFYTKKKK